MISGFNHITINEELTQENIEQLEGFIQNDKPLLMKFRTDIFSGTIFASKLVLGPTVAYGANYKTSAQSVAVLVAREDGQWRFLVDVIV